MQRKDSEIILPVYKASDSLIGGLKCKENGNCQIFPQIENNISYILNNTVWNITYHWDTNWKELLINQIDYNYAQIILHKIPFVRYLPYLSGPG